MYNQNDRLWAMTDSGAVTYFQMIAAIRQQRATIDALVGTVNRLQSQVNTLSAPKRPLLPASTVSPYSNIRRSIA